jgi:hypothetical protein
MDNQIKLIGGIKMNITEALKNQNKDVVQMVVSITGLTPNEVEKVMEQLLPAISKGVKTATGNKERASQIFNTLERDNRKLNQYIQQPRQQNPDEIRSEGENFLGMIFGDKEISRKIAEKVSEKTHVSDTSIKEALPFLVTAAMGAFNKVFNQQKALHGGEGKVDQKYRPGQDTQINQLLLQFFDADKDGSVLDDFMGLLGQFLGTGKTRH